MIWICPPLDADFPRKRHNLLHVSCLTPVLAHCLVSHLQLHNQTLQYHHSHRDYQLNVFTLWAVSSGSPPLMRIPLTAPTPVPTMTAVGVASPSAHGHAIHSTEMAYLKDLSITSSWKLRPVYNTLNTRHRDNCSWQWEPTSPNY